MIYLAKFSPVSVSESDVVTLRLHDVSRETRFFQDVPRETSRRLSPVKAVLQYHSRLIRGLNKCIFLTGLK